VPKPSEPSTKSGGRAESVTKKDFAELQATVQWIVEIQEQSKKHIDRLLQRAERLKRNNILQKEPFLFLVSYSIDPAAEADAREKEILMVSSLNFNKGMDDNTCDFSSDSFLNYSIKKA
jgi:hypothetical protein